MKIPYYGAKEEVLKWLRRQGWVTYGPWTACGLRAILVQPARPPQNRKKEVIQMMNIMCTFARVVGAVRDKYHNTLFGPRW